MTGRLRVNRIVWIGGAALVSVLAFAWYDGGAEPPLPMTAPTTLPQAVQ